MRPAVFRLDSGEYVCVSPLSCKIVSSGEGKHAFLVGKDGVPGTVLELDAAYKQWRVGNFVDAAREVGNAMEDDEMEDSAHCLDVRLEKLGLVRKPREI